MNGMIADEPDHGRGQPEIQLRWLLRLRWLSVVAQVLVILIFAFYYGYILPLGLLGGCLLFTAVTNLAVQLRKNNWPFPPAVVIFVLIVLDTATLTTMLYFTGGAHNPFSSLYLLHITLAAILLPAWGPWIVLGLCSLGFFVLFSSPHGLVRVAGPTCCSDMVAHLRGMLLGMVIAGAGIAFFVSRLRGSLDRHRLQLTEMQAVAARNERFASLATLSAGLAHELATPLGTIALVSADMEKHVGEVCNSQGCLEDARLIRKEVARCRAVLDRVANEITLSGQPGRTSPEPLAIRLVPELLKSFLSEGVLRCIRFDNMDTNRCLILPETALLQALAVLLKNACEASPPDEPVSLRYEETGEIVAFVVEDRGTGMSPDVREKAGEPFFTTKEPGRGMGLGLFVVRVFVEGMNGTVDIDSREGVGTTVRLAFPATANAPEAGLVS